jgi:hypothetical protein
MPATFNQLRSWDDFAERTDYAIKQMDVIGKQLRDQKKTVLGLMDNTAIKEYIL